MAYSKTANQEPTTITVGKLFDDMKTTNSDLIQLMQRYPKHEFLPLFSLECKGALEDFSTTLACVIKNLYESYENVLSYSGEREKLKIERETLKEQLFANAEQLEQTEQILKDLKKILGLPENVAQDVIDGKVAEMKKALRLLERVMDELQLSAGTEDDIVIEKIVAGKDAKKTIDELKGVLSLKYCSDPRVIRERFKQLLEYKKAPAAKMGNIGKIIHGMRAKQADFMNKINIHNAKDLLLIINPIPLHPPKPTKDTIKKAICRTSDEKDPKVRELEERVSDLKKRSFKIEKDFNKMAEEKRSLQDEIQKLKNKVDILDAELTNEKRKMDEFKTEYAELEEKKKYVECLEAQVAGKEKEIQDLKYNNETLEKKNREKLEQVIALIKT